MFRALLSALALTLTAGCTRDDVAYPSLAHRTAEDRGFAEPEAPPPVPITADPKLDTAIAEIGDRLTAAGKAFDAGAARARSLAARARGARSGSEAWIAAQVSLAELDSARADTSAAATDANQLALDRAAAQGGDYPALTALNGRAQTLLKAQGATITELNAGLMP